MQVRFVRGMPLTLGIYQYDIIQRGLKSIFMMSLKVRTPVCVASVAKSSRRARPVKDTNDIWMCMHWVHVGDDQDPYPSLPVLLGCLLSPCSAVSVALMPLPASAPLLAGARPGSCCCPRVLGAGGGCSGIFDKLGLTGLKGFPRLCCAAAAAEKCSAPFLLPLEPFCAWKLSWL